MIKTRLSIALSGFLLAQSPISEAAFAFGKPKQQLDLVGGIQGGQGIICRDNTVGITPIINQTIPIPSDAPNWTAQIKLYADADNSTAGFFTYSETNLVTNRTTNYFVADKNFSGTWTATGKGSNRRLSLNLYNKWKNNAGTTPPTVPAPYPLTLSPLPAVLKGRSANYPMCGSTSKKPCFTSRSFSFTVYESKTNVIPSEINPGNVVGKVLSSVQPLTLEYQDVIAGGLYSCTGKVFTNLVLKGIWDGKAW